MAVILLSIYIVLIFIRPMEWWDPVLGFNLLDNLAILLVPATFFTLKKEDFIEWGRLPETKLSILLLIGFSLSWLPWWRQSVITTFQSFGKIALLYNLILLLGRKRRSFHILLWTLFVCVIWMAVHGVLQHYSGYGFGDLPPRFRGRDEVYQIVAFGIFNDPNDLCLIFIVALPLIYAEFRASRNSLVKFILLAAAPLVAYAAWLTNSRGGVMGIFGMVITYVVMSTRGIKRWLVIFVSVMLICVVAPSRFANKLEVDVDRTAFWGIGISSFKATPIFGIGWGNFPDIARGSVAHNSFIQVLAETGAVGYFPWLLLISATCLHLLRAINLKGVKDAEREGKFYLSALLSALAGFLTAIYFISRGSNPVLYILLALATAKTAEVASGHELHLKVFGEWRADLRKGIFFCFGSIVFLWLTIRLANAIVVK